MSAILALLLLLQSLLVMVVLGQVRVQMVVPSVLAAAPTATMLLLVIALTPLLGVGLAPPTSR